MWVRIVVAALLAWGAPGLASAEPEPAPPPTTTGAAGAAAGSGTDAIPLSLHEAIALGIENNTDVQLIRYDPPISEYDYTAAWGAHDPTMFADYTYQSTNLPVASTFFPGSFVERTGNGNAGFFGLLPRLGWSYDLSYHGDSTSTNSFVQTLGKTYTSNLTASLNAPILKGAWWGGAWTQVQLTNIGTGVAYDEFRERLMDIVGGPPAVPIEQNLGIENAYWALAARKQELEVTVQVRTHALADRNRELEGKNTELSEALRDLCGMPQPGAFGITVEATKRARHRDDV
ncbi:MAG: hypothetical protein ABFS41_07455, partial [Myxococcota bacterium]